MKSVIFIIISCFFFSILAALIKFNSTSIHPVEQAFFRNFISIFFLSPLLLRKNLWSPQKKNFKLLILRGLLGGITMILLFCSYSLIPLSQAMAISFSTPIFVYIGGAFFFKEKTSKSMNFYIVWFYFNLNNNKTRSRNKTWNYFCDRSGNNTCNDRFISKKTLWIWKHFYINV